jgi:hypothetical protein
MFLLLDNGIYCTLILLGILTRTFKFGDGVKTLTALIAAPF